MNSNASNGAEPIRVLQVGLGPIGQKVTEHLAEKPQLRIAGAMDVDPAKIGLDLGEMTGVEAARGVTIAAEPADADVAVVTTTSDLESFAEQALGLIERGLHIVSTCEELSYPWRTSPATARRLDDAARAAGVAVLGTGVNPGFLMDLLPLAMTAVCRSVQKVYMARIQNAGLRRLPFQRKIGAGLTPAEFAERVAAGTLRHVGLTESMHMIAGRLGWTLDRVEDVVEPVIAEAPVASEFLQIEPGRAIGVNQVGRGWREGEEVITLVFRATVGEPNPRDRLKITGDPPIDMTIAGGTHGDVATCAIAVNAIPVVARARPGLRTMADLEPVACI